MTRRFPRTETLIPDDLLAKLIENGSTSEERDDFDPFPVVKLSRRMRRRHVADEAYPEGPDVKLYGLMDFGLRSPELGYANAQRDRGGARKRSR